MIAMPTLPYAYNALEPSISRASVENHFQNHHKRYAARANELLTKTDLADAELEEILHATAKRKAMSELFRNAAQVWNHTFFWRSMKPGGGGVCTGEIRTRLETDFKGYDNFAATFRKAAGSLFGSGWVWLVLDANKLKIVTTKDAQTPIIRELHPLLTLDLWEHAYYPDYGAKRLAYVDAYLSSLLNWEFANENLTLAKSGSALAGPNAMRADGETPPLGETTTTP